MENSPLVPMYLARVADLRAGESVGCIYDSCGHASHITVRAIQDRVAGWTFVNKLGKKLRCTNCEVLGECIVDARRALGYAQ